MTDTEQPNPAPKLVAEGRTLEEMADAAEHCTACELYQDATNVVFGAGGEGSRLLLVGEQPGDAEDRAGEPFVGPAGGVLDAALDEAGIPREAVYVTNIVKHFRFKSAGKRRLHQKPASRHIAACIPWFRAEVERVDPAVIVCLGATPAQALLGRGFKVTQDRGIPHEWEGHLVVATIHPSATLRAPEAEERRRLRALLAGDLRAAWDLTT